MLSEPLWWHACSQLLSGGPAGRDALAANADAATEQLSGEDGARRPDINAAATASNAPPSPVESAPTTSLPAEAPADEQQAPPPAQPHPFEDKA